MKVLIHDKYWHSESLISVNVSEEVEEWLRLTLNEYNDMFYNLTGEKPITLIAKERIMQKAEVYKC